MILPDGTAVAMVNERVLDWESILGAGSPLAGRSAGFRPRSSQIALAEAVHEAFEGGGMLVAEAATGVGKSLAYLASAAFAGRRVVVSTATKTLQEQLRARDIPLARLATGEALTAAVVKGRGNYLCRAQLAVVDGRLPGMDERAGLERLRPWIAATRSGDRDELDHVPPSALWSELAVGSDRCRGRQCSFHASCHSERARQAAGDVEVVLVNHALYMADLGLRIRTGGELSVLPEHDTVVFDEAHDLADAAADWLGLRLSMSALVRLSRDVERAADSARIDPPAAELRALRLHAERFFGSLPGGARARLRRDDLDRLPLDAADGMRAALSAVGRTLRGTGEEADAIARHVDGVARELAGLLQPDLEETVVWCERSRPGDVELRTAPIEVGPVLADVLWSQVHSAVLVSATLAIGEDLSYTKARLGLDDARGLVLPSPFAIAEQSRLYVPKSGATTSSGAAGASARSVADEVRRLVVASGGRALVLFSSYRQLAAVHELLAGGLPYTLLRQGELPRDLLLERFRTEVASVLLATASFWQGVDVPGEALSLLVIDKLPFAPPDDPLVSARCDAATRRGASAFGVVQLPRAAMMLRQGTGRLLRTETDRGVIAILDRRFVDSSYGAYLQRALPEIQRIDEVEEVASFLAGPPLG